MNTSEKDHHYATLQHDSIGIEQTPTVRSRNSDLETTAEKIGIRCSFVERVLMIDHGDRHRCVWWWRKCGYSLSNNVVANGCDSDDRWDRQQWHAFPSFCHCGCGTCAWCPPHYISRFVFCRVWIWTDLLIDSHLGLFALYTAFILVDFKLNHPEVHNMGDAGRIMGGSILREILSAGTVIFAIAAAGSQLLAGQIALSALANNRLCLMLATGKYRTWNLYKQW